MGRSDAKLARLVFQFSSMATWDRLAITGDLRIEKAGKVAVESLIS